MTINFTVNNKAMSFDGDIDMPLLWYLRDHAKLTGTKYGCGIAECGACTVHIDGRAVRSCVTPLKNIERKNIETIEGLAQGKELHAVQQAWIEEDVSQCGYCQSGQLMAAADLLSRNKDPDNKDIAGITNICRCGTYPRIRKAILRAAQIIKGQKS
jgi:isoquinoline 1-oxidoreductase alpha subunit